MEASYFGMTICDERRVKVNRRCAVGRSLAEIRNWKLAFPRRARARESGEPIGTAVPSPRSIRKQNDEAEGSGIRPCNDRLKRAQYSVGNPAEVFEKL